MHAKSRDNATMLTLVVSAVDSPKTAKQIAKNMVKDRLAACAQVIPRVTSFYRWEGKVRSAREYLMVFKTSPSLTDRLIAAVREAHPYEVPEILSQPANIGNPAYAEWLNQNLIER
jgi:periplasmic divalent cation tolerance protein